MIVLIDTDILIDLALDRKPYAEPAGRLLDALQNRPGTAFIAWHTVSNFYYLVVPTQGRESCKAFLSDLVRFVDVAPTTTDSLRYAAKLDMKDFEDAMQVAAGMACHADVIATRNVRDYAKAPLRATTPRAVLDEM
ncbi:MAG: type II toxin-antitoxin system VapC family toxin [Chromatiales bacterium]